MKYLHSAKILLGLFAAAGLAASTGTDARSAPPTTRHKAVRTLDAITIEGEIVVPRVLFITSRDVRRYRDGLDVHYRKTALEVARPFGLPTRVRVVAQTRQHKEEAK